MRTCSVQMPIKSGCDNDVRPKRCCFGGVVLTELLIVLAIITMLIGTAMFFVDGFYGNTKFHREAREFMNVLQFALNSAAESDQRYAVAINLDEESYSMHQFMTMNKDDISAYEPIITKGKFKDTWFEYVIYDDGDDSRSPGEGQEAFRMWFMAGHAGWENGAIIVLSDVDENLYSVVLNRLNRTVSIYDGALELADCGFLETKTENELPFQ